MKQKIIDFIKFTLFIFMMFMGFFSTYAVVWVQIGLPDGLLPSLLVMILSIISEWGYVKWLAN